MLNRETGCVTNLRNHTFPYVSGNRAAQSTYVTMRIWEPFCETERTRKLILVPFLVTERNREPTFFGPAPTPVWDRILSRVSY